MGGHACEPVDLALEDARRVVECLTGRHADVEELARAREVRGPRDESADRSRTSSRSCASALAQAGGKAHDRSGLSVSVSRLAVLAVEEEQRELTRGRRARGRRTAGGDATRPPLAGGAHRRPLGLDGRPEARRGEAVRTLACGPVAPHRRARAVAFDDRVRLMAPLRAVDAPRLRAAIASIGPGGSTNFSGGWLRGLGELVDAPADGPRKNLLLTDGLANAGITDPDDLTQMARRRGSRASRRPRSGLARVSTRTCSAIWPMRAAATRTSLPHRTYSRGRARPSADRPASAPLGTVRALRPFPPRR